MGGKHFNSMDEDERTRMMARLNEVMLDEFGVTEGDVGEMWRTITFGIETKAAFKEIGDEGGIQFFNAVKEFREQN